MIEFILTAGAFLAWLSFGSVLSATIYYFFDGTRGSATLKEYLKELFI